LNNFYGLCELSELRGEVRVNADPSDENRAHSGDAPAAAQLPNL